MNKQKLLIAYKNGTSDEFTEDQLDCSEWTLRGHTSRLINEWKQTAPTIYKLDHYNAIDLSEVISIRITR